MAIVALGMLRCSSATSPPSSDMPDENPQTSVCSFNPDESLEGMNVYYVDQLHSAANDTNPGTEDLPWLTFQHGIDMAVANDLVWVKAGIYFENLEMRRSGQADAPIVFQAYPGDMVIIDGSNSSDYKMIDWKGASSNGADKNYIVLDGFEIRNGARWGLWIEGNHNTIRNCKVHSHGLSDQGAGILIREGNHNTIRCNEVYNNGWNGIHAENSNYTVIEYNIAHHNVHHFGINVFPKTAGPQNMESENHIRYNTVYENKGGIYLRYQQDNEIIGNLIYDNAENGIFFHSHGDGSQIYEARSKVFNNTIVNNGLSGIYNIKATHLYIRNNIIAFHTEAGGDYEIFMGNDYTNGHVLDYNLYDSDADNIVYWGGNKYRFSEFQSATGNELNGLAQAPGFMNVQDQQFQLNTNSPAIDAGDNLGEVLKDLEGTLRPQGAGIDIGAYEMPSPLPPPMF